ncbi:MAG: hypothetical protein ACI8UD_001968, partial [Planctomycetota bacterium]
ERAEAADDAATIGELAFCLRFSLVFFSLSHR